MVAAPRGCVQGWGKHMPDPSSAERDPAPLLSGWPILAPPPTPASPLQDGLESGAGHLSCFLSPQSGSFLPHSGSPA